MKSALIGHTGFVGGNLASQNPFDALFNSKNIKEIRGQHYDLLVISGAPAAKWIANRDPEADLANLDRLMLNLDGAEADFTVLMSTVDVYPDPREVDESTPIDQAKQHAYGRNRLLLEEFVAQRYPQHLILRLPGLFGRGLKKNAIYDFLHDNETHKIHADGVFQFYCLDHLWDDIERIRRAELSLVNVATEPVSIAEVTRAAFGFEFDNRPAYEPARYDFRTQHDLELGGRDGYLYDKAQVLADLESFVARERGAAR